MAYVDLTELSGMAQFLMRTGSIRAIAPRVVRKVATVPRRMVTALRQVAPPQPTILTAVVARREPTVLKAVVAPRRPTVLKPAVIAPRVMPPRPKLVKPAVVTARELEKTKIRRLSPMWFKQSGIAKKMIQRLRTPSGATHKATQVKVVPGPDPVAKSITGAGAPLTGQTVSLKEPDPIVPVVPSPQGITLVEKPAPVAMPIVSVEPTEVKPPVAKAGLSPIVWLILSGIALSILLKPKKGWSPGTVRQQRRRAVRRFRRKWVAK